MDDESLNGGDTKSSALSMEEEEELEEDGVSLTTTSSSAAATPPPPPPPQLQQQPLPSLPSARVRTSSRASEEADQSAHKLLVAGPKMGPTPPPLQTIAVKRRRELEPDELIIIPSASRPSPPATAAAAAAVQPPHPPSLPTQHPLLSADLLHSLQYFALLRQSLPNGKNHQLLFYFYFSIFIFILKFDYQTLDIR
jgi:hypothetical protein